MTKIYVVVWEMRNMVKAYTNKEAAEAEVAEINHDLYMGGYDRRRYAYVKETELVTD